MQKAKTNEAIREVLKTHNVKLWQLADILNVSEMTVNRMLRHELPADKQNVIISLIENRAKDINS